VVVTNLATSAIVNTIEMPAINISYPDTSWSTSTSSFEGTNAPSNFNYDMYYWQSEPTISTLLLHEDRLLVVVSGYGEMHKERTSTGRPLNVLDSFKSTHVRVYDKSVITTSSSPSSGLLGSTNMNGIYAGLRSSNGIVHIAGSSSVRSYDLLQSPMESLMSSYLGDEEGFANATFSLSSNFTTQLMRDLRADGKPTPNLFRISLLQNSTSVTNIEEIAFNNGIMNTLALVHSFDLNAENINETLANMSSSGAFAPFSFFNLYGTAEKMVMSGEVYSYDSRAGTSQITTSLLGFASDGATTKPHSVGTVPGVVMTSRAIDVVGDTIRVATTVTKDTWTTNGEWMTNVTSTNASSGTFAPSDWSSQNFNDMMWPRPDTENYIIVMQMPGPNGTNAGMMTEMGRVKVGKPQESFTAVHFMDQIAYVMTFLYLDPFYVIDLSDPTDPKAIGELEVPGFSRDMFPIDANKTMLLAIGALADEVGSTTGLQLTVFDVSVPTSPVAKFIHNITRASNTSSISTDSLWDTKATRFTNGHLFLVVDLYDYDYSESSSKPESFHGTKVFTVDPISGIAEKTACQVTYNQVSYSGYYEETDVTTTTSNTSSRLCPYYGGSLLRRSMVFGDNVLSTSVNEVILTNFQTCQRVWNDTIQIMDECSTDTSSMYNEYDDGGSW
jgi:Beta propeller domain